MKFRNFFLREGLIIISVLFIFSLVAPWSPKISYDTQNFYYPQVKVKTQGVSAVKYYGEIFYRYSSSQKVYAHEAKPFYVLALRLWAALYHSIFSQKVLPSDSAFTGFMMLSVLLMAWMIYKLGSQIGDKHLGIAAAVITVVSPWHCIFLYYPAYLQFSMFLFLGACYLIFKKTYLSVGLSGLICSVALLSNNAILVFVAGLIGLIVVLLLPNWKRVFLSIVIFLAGFCSVFIIFKVIQFLPIVRNVFEPGLFEDPLTTLIRYYRVSIYHNHFQQSQVPYFPGMLFLILRYNGWFLLLSFIGAILIVFSWILQAGLRNFWQQQRIRIIVLSWLPAFLAIALVELRSGVQFGRIYFVAFPFILLGTIAAWKDLAQKSKILKWITITLVILFVVETGMKLHAQNLGFHQVGYRVCQKLDRGERVALCRQDAYAPALQMLIEKTCPGIANRLEWMNSIQPDPNIKLLIGPSRFSIWSAGYNAGMFMGPGLSVTKAGIGPWLYVGLEEIPYYALYPLLMFEDEIQTWNLILKRTQDNSFSKGIGAAHIGRISDGYFSRHDIDGDGLRDHVYLRKNADSYEIWFSRNMGTSFQELQRIVILPEVDPNYLFFVDSRGDGSLDVLYLDKIINPCVWVSRLQEGRYSSPQKVLCLQGNQADHIRFGDVNADGRNDIIVFDYNQTKRIQIFLSNGKNFVPLQEINQQNNPGIILNWFCVDLNKDRRSDLVVLAKSREGQRTLYVNMSTGFSFGIQKRLAEIPNNVSKVLFLDLDGNQQTDMVFLINIDGRHTGVVTSFLSENRMVSSQELFVLEGVNPERIYVFDINGDDRDDLMYYSDISKMNFAALSTGISFLKPQVYHEAMFQSIP